MPTFTAHSGKAAMTMSCRGLNHRDQGPIGVCDGCGAEVVKTTKGHFAEVRHRMGGARFYYCWMFHECDAKAAERKVVADAEAIVAGQVPKGSEVVVFKGRKVAIGTEGVVRWTGTDSYDNARVGLAVEGEEKLVYLPAANVKIADEAVIAAAAEIVAEHKAKWAAFEEKINALRAERTSLIAEMEAFWASLQQVPEGEERKAAYEAGEAGYEAMSDRIVAINAEAKDLIEAHDLDPIWYRF